MSDSLRSRWVALVGALTHERRAAHTAGFPLDPEKMLPVADVVLMVPDDAAYEYGDALIAWLEVPSEINDAHAFAVRYAYERLDSRGGW